MKRLPLLVLVAAALLSAGVDAKPRRKKTAASEETELAQARSRKKAAPEAETSTLAEARPSTAAPMVLDETSVEGRSGDRQQLAEATALFDGKDYEGAALSALDLSNRLSGPNAAAAQVVLGKSLYRLGLYHSAQSVFSKLLAQGPTSPQFGKALEWLVFIGQKTVNAAALLEDVSKVPETSFPDRFRSELLYVLAHAHASAGRVHDVTGSKSSADASFAEVKRAAQKISRGDPFYGRAKYLEGLALFREDRHQEALEAMKEVIRSTRTSSGSEARRERDRRLRDLAFVQLARIHYGKRQFKHAHHYFRKVARGGEQWLESLFEDAWATYRMNDDETALGNLVTLASPSFRFDYYPEAHVLAAVIYYQNCRFDEARARVEEFQRIYLPVQEQLKALTQGGADSAAFYELLKEQQSKSDDAKSSGSGAIMERVLRLALSNKDLESLNAAILEVEAELEALSQRGSSFSQSSLAQSLADHLKARRATLIERAGSLARTKLAFETTELGKLIENAERIKFEIVNAEKTKLEAKLTGQKTREEQMSAYDLALEVGEDQLYWPLNDEYWRDELGTYLYTMTHGCADQR